MGWKCIAIHWFVLQRRGLDLYCKKVLYCNRGGMAAGSSVLQYTALYCGWKGCRRQGCINTTWSIVTGGRAACVATRRWARGARRQALGHGCWGGRRAGADGRAGRGKGARQVRARGARQASAQGE